MMFSGILFKKHRKTIRRRRRRWRRLWWWWLWPGRAGQNSSAETTATWHAVWQCRQSTRSLQSVQSTAPSCQPSAEI